jgi:sulfite oxidase
MQAAISRRDWLRYSSAAAGGMLLPDLVHRALAEETSPAGGELLVRSQNPYNAEPPLARLVASSITPVEHFYVRNHGPTPKVQAADFRVRVEGLVRQPLELSLAEIKDKFKERALAATLTCAGNRRMEMSAQKPVAGVQWDAGAIGNARWTGPALAEVLKSAEVQPGAKHVWFEGLDPIKEKDGSVAPFGGSIPLDKAAANENPVLLAHAMGGAALSAAHGFPLRTVVPGYIGARSVKWLTKILVSDRPSPNHYVAEAYKIVTGDSRDELAQASPIYEFPINAAICTPQAGSSLKAGTVFVAGYALPSGDGKAAIAKVELSTDAGRTWKAVELEDKPAPYCWQVWKTEITLAAGKHELVVRATDSAGRAQPQRGEWNLKGYLYNAWHRCAVEARL